MEKDQTIAVSDTAIIGALNVLGYKAISMQRKSNDNKRVEFVYPRSKEIEEHYQLVLDGKQLVVVIDFAMELHSVRNKIKHFNNINPL